MIYPLLFVVATGLFAGLVWSDRRLALYLIAAGLPVYLLRIEVFGVPTTLLEVWIVTLIAVAFFKKEITLPRFPKRWRKPVALLLTAAMAGVIVAPDTVAALGIFKAYFVEPLLIFWVAHTYLDTPTRRKKVVWALLAGGVLVASFALFQRATGLGIPLPWDIERRATGFFSYPNALGLYLGPLAVLAAIGTVRFWRQQKTTALILAGTFGLFMTAIVFAQSEAALLAVPAALFVSSLFFTRSRRIALIVAAATLLVAVVVPNIYQPAVEKLTLQDYSGQVRLKQWSETWALLQHKPIFGAGLSGYPIALESFHTHHEIEIFQYPHTFLFNIWVELGLLGLVAVAWIATMALKDTKRLLQYDRAAGWAGLAAAVVLLEMTIHGLVDVPYFKNDLSVLTWLLIALLSISAHENSQNK